MKKNNKKKIKISIKLKNLVKKIEKISLLELNELTKVLEMEKLKRKEIIKKLLKKRARAYDEKEWLRKWFKDNGSNSKEEMLKNSRKNFKKYSVFDLEEELSVPFSD